MSRWLFVGILLTSVGGCGGTGRQCVSGPPGACKGDNKSDKKCPKQQPYGAPTQNRVYNEETSVTREASVDSVGQEILLVPRTVYVPYSAQVPVTTMRVNRRNVQGETVETVTTQQMDYAPRETSPKGTEKGGCDRETSIKEVRDALLKCQERLRQLDTALSPAEVPVAAPRPGGAAELAPAPVPVPATAPREE
jgi:hypothetical protein